MSKLRELRAARKLPMIGLAVQARISTATLGAIERFGYVPSKERQERLADALGVSVADIWPETQKGADGSHAA